MAKLEPPDIHHLLAAIGWVELGNPLEARNELSKISDEQRGHPDVLEGEWRIHAAAKSWTAALQVARRQIQAAKSHPAGWINQSYALHELKRTQEAFDQLLPLAKRFPKISVIHYNLACYACQLGHLEVAKRNLARAIKQRGKDEVKKMALADADLKPLREYVRAL
ncbi:MAG: tetratricopeptide repeat protein [Verrucomicrobia bacterium]|nr:tetratricopeptide repeat protein [Verrucomicrobiota bacterium]